MRDRLVALEVAIGAVGAEALDRRVNEARVDFRERLIAEPEPVERARPEILQEHIGLGDDLSEQPLAVIGLQVEGQAALVGVEQQKEQAVAVLDVAHVAARDVAALRLLELDHIGAEKRQDLRTSRPRLVVRHVDDADAGQGLGHVTLPEAMCPAG